MRRIYATALAAGLTLILTAAAARSQGPATAPPPVIGGPDGPPLVMVDAVQEDLKLTDKQREKLKELRLAMAQRRRAAFNQRDEQGFDPQAIMAEMHTFRRTQDAAVARILDKDQKARLAQIELRREGLLAVARHDVATKLKLSAAQSRKVKEIVDGMRKTVAQTMPIPHGGLPFVANFPDAVGEGFPNEGGFAGAYPTPDGFSGDFMPQDGNPDLNPAPGNNPAGRARPRGARKKGGRAGPAPETTKDAAPTAEPPTFNAEELHAKVVKMGETIEKARTAASREIGEVLKPDQKDAFDKMLGEPFDLARLRMAPPTGPRPDGVPAKAGERPAPRRNPKAERPAP